MENKIINKAIFELWKEQFNNDQKVYAPLFYGDFVKNSILFVGCNPSFSKKAFARILKGTKYEGIDLKWNNISKDLKNIEKCVAVEKQAIKGYNIFFRHLKNIAEKVNLPFQHADIFLYRQTSQSEFKKCILKKGKINDFGIKQILIFKKIVNNTQPKVIVVANAFASSIIREQFKDLISEFDIKKGFHCFTLANNRKVPIFFSSMITGQRAMDVYSRERLTWHIEQAIKN